MQPMIIDIAGTVKQLVKRVLVEALWFLGVILFALSAPLIYTVGAWYRYPQCAGYLGIGYLLTAPIACCIWTLLLSAFGFDREKYTFYRRHGRYMGFMIGGFLGSVLAEVVMMVALMHTFPGGGNNHLMLIFTVAPFFAFSPVLLVLLSRWIRRDKYASA